MATKRQQKFSKLIKEELSQIFQRELSSEFSGKLVTITDVVMSPDLGLAKSYISVFPISEADKVISIINDAKSRIRGRLGSAIGKQIRIVPELAFFVDSTAEVASKMDALLDSLDIPEAPDEEE